MSPLTINFCVVLIKVFVLQGPNWIIAGIVIGSVALIALVVVLALFCRSRRRKRYEILSEVMAKNL